MNPKEKIGPLGMAPAVKFFSEVKKRFWINDKDKAAPYGGSLAIGQVWEGTDNQTRLEGRRGEDEIHRIVLSVFAGPIRPGREAPKPDDFIKGLEHLYPGYTEQSDQAPPLPLRQLARRAFHHDRLRVADERANLHDRPEAQQAVPRPPVLRRRTHADGLLRLHGGCIAFR